MLGVNVAVRVNYVYDLSLGIVDVVHQSKHKQCRHTHADFLVIEKLFVNHFVGHDKCTKLFVVFKILDHMVTNGDRPSFDSMFPNVSGIIEWFAVRPHVFVVHANVVVVVVVHSNVVVVVVHSNVVVVVVVYKIIIS